MKSKNRHSRNLTRRIAVQILTDLGSPFSVQLASLLEQRRDAEVLSLCRSFDPHDASLYNHWRNFYLDYQAASLLKKWDGLETGVDTKLVAEELFKITETKCRETNKRLALDRYGVNSPPWAWQAIQLARDKIGRVLGDFSWDYAHRYMAFGPGAAVGVPRKRAHQWYKIRSENLTVTGECLALAQAAIAVCPQWTKVYASETSDREPLPPFQVVEGSKVTTVPKDASTDRVIAIEPLMNMYIQKGIGGLIRSRLRRAGVDLNDQSRNQRLAQQGSLHDNLATLDMKSASDTVSKNIVELLLPEDWVTAMKLCRSQKSTLNGETFRLAKFSSMGNGYTFELESLIFWGLASACVQLTGEKGRDIGIYGDDIIVPSPSSGLLIDVLEHCGFETNMSKSFVSGPFRESCGKHYFMGHDVTPLYIRKDVSGPQRKLWCLNSIRRLAHRFIGASYGCWDAFLPSYELVQSCLDKKTLSLSVPENFGDGGVLRDFDEACPRRHPTWDGFVFPALIERRKHRLAHGQAALFLALRDLEEKSAPARVGAEGVSILNIMFGIPVSKVKKTCFTPLWVGLGPWLSLL